MIDPAIWTDSVSQLLLAMMMTMVAIAAVVVAISLRRE
jgi:hypothetical protein